MSTEQNQNSGVLFKNRHKNKDTHPDYTGNGNYEGVEFDIAAWVKLPKKGGDKFMSISFKPPYQKEGGGRRASQQNNEPQEEEDAPF